MNNSTEKVCRIVIGGDLMPAGGNEALFSAGDACAIADKGIVDIIRSADFSVCNLEGVLTSRNEAREKTGPSLKADPSCINGIRSFGWSCVGLANNHSTDYESEGLEDTIDLLEANGMQWIGAVSETDSSTAYITLEINDVRVTIYAVSEQFYNAPNGDNLGANLYDELIVIDELRQLRAQCDCLIVLYHGGVEDFAYPSPWTKKTMQRIVSKGGADVVLSQHTHRLGAREYFNGSYLLYGQGDFLLARGKRDERKYGVLLELTITKSGFEVNEHFIKRDECCLHLYDSAFESFIQRCARLEDGDDFAAEYDAFVKKKFAGYYKDYRPRTLVHKLLDKIYCKKLGYGYSAEQLMKHAHTYRNPLHRELLIAAFSKMHDEPRS